MNQPESPKPESLQPNVTELEIPPRFLFLCLLTGIGAGITSGLLMNLLWFAQQRSFLYRTGDFLAGVEHVSGMRRVEVLIAAGVIAGIGLYLIHRFSGKSSADLSKSIWEESGQLQAGATFIRAMLSIVIVGMGAALGRESALKQGGAAIASKLSDFFHITLAQRHLLVACGAGAGMAAAYNVPFGGAIFTLEVLLGSITLPVVIPAFIAAFTGTAVSWLMLPNRPTYVVSNFHTTVPIVLWALVAGPFLGLASAAYVKGVRWASTHKPKGWQMVALPIVIFAAIGVAAVRFPEILGNGKNVAQLAFDAQVATPLLCWLFLLRPLATVLCMRSGAPGGLFTPTIAFGAVSGALLGQGWGYLFPTAEKPPYALLGAGALLSASTQAPLSSVVFMLELTHHMDAMVVPLLLAAAGASLTSNAIEPYSIYSSRI